MIETLKRSVQIAQALAKEHHQPMFSPAHLMMGVLHNEVGLASWLGSLNIDIHYLREWAEVRMEASPKGNSIIENTPGDEKVKSVMEMADLVAMQLNKSWTDPACVFIALLKPGLAFTAEQLKSLPVAQKEIMDAAIEDVSVESATRRNAGVETGDGKNAEYQSVASANLFKYCTDKTALAREGKLDPIIGRDKEVRTIMEVLGRRTKPNVIIVGEPGVGKTALVDGFVLELVAKKAPAHLQTATLFELDMGALIAGASYKGEIEDRIKNIIKEVKQHEKAILFIDEIHTLLDSRGSVGTGVVNLLKPELARGELTVIGATTNDEYRKYIESDEAFSRRFEVVRVEEPDTDTAVRMLQKLLPFYEQHHQLEVQIDALKEAVTLSQRYIKDRRLPDAAVDLLDRTLAAIRMMAETSDTVLHSLGEELEIMIGQNGTTSLADFHWFHRELKSKISPILMNQLEENEPMEELEVKEVVANLLEQKIISLRALTDTNKKTVDKNDVAAVISNMTGIPLGKIQSKERDKLLTIEEVLKKRVIGQDQAVKALSDAILESRSGLTKAGQPVGSFFLLGPTGTGKTELAKALADFLFNDESYLIRFDMSEFKEEHSAALLYGAPPGYVGYEEGGVLVNKIREKPYSVVLFDEIEKAHPSVFDIFLQILDEGKLHDRLGKEGDFSNAVILFTSNIGSEFVIDTFGKGEIPAANQLMEIMSRHFRPEFLARLTEIVPFAPITEENALLIFDLHLKSLVGLLKKQGIGLDLSAEARKNIALSGFTPKYGARQLKGVIRNRLRRPISRMIVGGEIGKGNDIQVTENQSDIKFEIFNNQSLIINH